MKSFEGKRPDGTKITSEVYRDMTTGETHYPMDKDGNLEGWDGRPPELPSGEKPPQSDNEKYIKGYEGVTFDGGKLVDGKWVVSICKWCGTEFDEFGKCKYYVECPVCGTMECAGYHGCEEFDGYPAGWKVGDRTLPRRTKCLKWFIEGGKDASRR